MNLFVFALLLTGCVSTPIQQNSPINSDGSFSFFFDNNQGRQFRNDNGNAEGSVIGKFAFQDSNGKDGFVANGEGIQSEGAIQSSARNAGPAIEIPSPSLHYANRQQVPLTEQQRSQDEEPEEVVDQKSDIPSPSGQGAVPIVLAGVKGRKPEVQSEQIVSDRDDTFPQVLSGQRRLSEPQDVKKVVSVGALVSSGGVGIDAEKQQPVYNSVPVVQVGQRQVQIPVYSSIVNQVIRDHRISPEIAYQIGSQSIVPQVVTHLNGGQIVPGVDQRVVQQSSVPGVVSHLEVRQPQVQPLVQVKNGEQVEVQKVVNVVSGVDQVGQQPQQVVLVGQSQPNVGVDQRREQVGGLDGQVHVQYTHTIVPQVGGGLASSGVDVGGQRVQVGGVPTVQVGGVQLGSVPGVQVGVPGIQGIGGVPVVQVGGVPVGVNGLSTVGTSFGGSGVSEGQKVQVESQVGSLEVKDVNGGVHVQQQKVVPQPVDLKQVVGLQKVRQGVQYQQMMPFIDRHDLLEERVVLHPQSQVRVVQMPYSSVYQLSPWGRGSVLSIGGYSPLKTSSGVQLMPTFGEQYPYPGVQQQLVPFSSPYQFVQYGQQVRQLPYLVRPLHYSGIQEPSIRRSDDLVVDVNPKPEINQRQVFLVMEGQEPKPGLYNHQFGAKSVIV